MANQPLFVALMVMAGIWLASIALLMWLVKTRHPEAAKEMDCTEPAALMMCLVQLLVKNAGTGLGDGVVTALVWFMRIWIIAYFVAFGYMVSPLSRA